MCLYLILSRAQQKAIKLDYENSETVTFSARFLQETDIGIAGKKAPKDVHIVGLIQGREEKVRPVNQGFKGWEPWKDWLYFTVRAWVCLTSATGENNFHNPIGVNTHHCNKREGPQFSHRGKQGG